jgi:predicted dehydrogenase
MYLTPEQRALGRDNANVVIGSTRRDFLKAAAAVPAAGAFYFGYEKMGDKPPVRAAIIGTGNEGCQAMIRDHNREYLNYIGFCDARPTQQARAREEFSKHKDYTKDDVAKLKSYADYKEMLADPDVEMVVIALPLWLHAPIAIEAMKAGKHVFCEKLMAHNVGECKDMVRTAHDKNKLLAIGHQRHYSALYDNANYLVQNGHLGEIRHIRALWHRNNAIPMIEKDKDGKLRYDGKGEPVYKRDDAGNVLYYDSWKPDIPEADSKIDFKKYGYKSLDELIRWRLYDRTGAGLMAELGSHQLDACSIFLGKVHPLSVTGVGGSFFFRDNREVDDHVFVTFEFPGKEGPKDKDRVVVTYSSINTNAFEPYGETVMGTRGTMIVEQEREIMLFKEADRNKSGGGPSRTTSVTVETKAGGKPTVEASPTAAGPSAASSLGGLATADPSRGYREELEHFAYCIRHGDASNYHADEKHRPRCRGEVALADAVIALTSNLAMRQRRRIEFDERWFDHTSPEVPEGTTGTIAKRS